MSSQWDDGFGTGIGFGLFLGAIAIGVPLMFVGSCIEESNERKARCGSCSGTYAECLDLVCTEEGWIPTKKAEAE